MKKVVTVGGATRDIFITQDQPQMLQMFLREGKRSFVIYESGRKIEVKNLDYHTGGGATNTAASFKNLGFDVSIVCKVGQDQDGDYIIKVLQDRKINTDAIIRDPTQPTASSFIIPLEGGDNVALVYRGANLTITNQEVPFGLFNGVDQVYITALGGQTASLLLPLVQYAKKVNCTIAVNPGSRQLAAGNDFLRDALPYIDILILNNVEAHQCLTSMMQVERPLQMKLLAILGSQKPDDSKPQLLRTKQSMNGFCFDLPFFAQEIMARGPKIVVVTNGKEGVYVAFEDQIYFHPSLSTSVICSLGAGDAFGSAFVGWLLHGYSIEEAIRAGLSNSSSVIGCLGTKVGLLAFDELKRRIQNIDANLLKKFPLKMN